MYMYMHMHMVRRHLASTIERSLCESSAALCQLTVTNCFVFFVCVTVSYWCMPALVVLGLVFVSTMLSDYLATVSLN